MNPELKVILGYDVDQATIKKVTSSFEEMGRKMQKVGLAMTLSVTAPILATAVYIKKMASDTEESMNKVDVAFKDSAIQIKDFSKTTLKEFGIASSSALDMAALYGDMATGMGINTSEAAKMSAALVGLAGDLSSFKNINLDIANSALKSIFTGETESLKNLGIVMTQANLEAFALANGLNVKIASMSEAEKVSLRYAYVLEKTKNAQGDFARTGGGAANQTRIFHESLKEIGASFGSIILPYFTKGITKVNEIVQAFGNLDQSVKKNILIGAGIAALIGPALWAFGQVAASITQIGLALGALASPVAITGIILVGTAYYVLTHWEKVRKLFYELEEQFFALKMQMGTALYKMGLISAKTAFGDLAIGLEKVNRYAEESEGGISGFAKAIQKAREEIKELLSGIKGLNKEKDSVGSEGYSDLQKSNISPLKSIQSGFAGKYSKEWTEYFEDAVRVEELLDTLGDKVTKAGERLKARIPTTLEGVTKVYSERMMNIAADWDMINATIKDSVFMGISAIGEVFPLAFASIFNKDIDFKKGFKQLLGRFLSGLGDMVMAMAIKLKAVAALKTTIEASLATVGGGAIGLAAAAGLFALGAAMKGGGMALSNASGVSSSNSSFQGGGASGNYGVQPIRVTFENGALQGYMNAQTQRRGR